MSKITFCSNNKCGRVECPNYMGSTSGRNIKSTFDFIDCRYHYAFNRNKKDNKNVHR